MALTPYSLLTAFLWSSVFILILLALRGSRRRVSLFAGLTPYLILTAGVLLRCLVPMEFPFFTKVLHGGGVVDALFDFLLQPALTVVPTKWLVALLWVWLGGFLVCFTRFLARCVRFSQKVSTYEPIENERAKRIVSQVAEELKTTTPKLAQTIHVGAPQVFGFFRPTVLLPGCEYTDEEYRLVFLHELQHWKSRDLWVKLLAELYVMVFWWNPCSYLLKRGLSETLELRCDEKVLKSLSEEDAEAYRRVLHKTLSYELERNAGKKDKPYVIAEFSAAGDRAIHERFQRLTEEVRYPKAKKFCTVFGVILSIFLFFASYAYVIQPRYDTPIEEIETERYISVDPEDVYLTLDSDGNYYLFFGDGEPELVSKDRANRLIANPGFPVYRKAR